MSYGLAVYDGLSNVRLNPQSRSLRIVHTFYTQWQDESSSGSFEVPDFSIDRGFIAAVGAGRNTLNSWSWDENSKTFSYEINRDSAEFIFVETE